MQHKVAKKSDSKRKQGKNHAQSLVSADTKRPSDQPTTSSSRRSTSKKRMLEEDFEADPPAKRSKTDGSKKVGSTTSNSRRSTSKKRMLEEDLEADPPAKHAKTAGSKKVGRLGNPEKTIGRRYVTSSCIKFV